MDIKECSPEFWDEFVDKSPQGTLFNKTFFLKSLGLPVKCLICFKGDEAVGGMAFIEETGSLTMPLGHINGIILKDLGDCKNYTRNETVFYVLEAFAEYLFEHYASMDFACHWDIIDMRPFDWVNYHEPEKGRYQISPRYTSLVDISTPGDTGQYAHKRRIPDLKKGIKDHQFKTIETHDIDLLDRFVSMNYDRQELKRPERESTNLRCVCQSLLEHQAARIMVTYVDGVPAVATCFAYDRHRAYYLFAGTDNSFRDLGVGTKNFYESSIMLNRDLGIKEIDMVGINSPLRASYKLSFGGRVVLYFRIGKYVG